MNGYLVSVTISVIASGVVSMLAPDNSNTKRYLSYLCGICIISSMLMPVNVMLGKIPELIDSVSVGGNYIESEDVRSCGDILSEILEDEISEAVKKDIKSRFGRYPEKVVCIIDYNDEEREAVIKEINVYLENLKKYEKSDIERYLSGVYDCDINAFECGDENE